MVDAPDDTERDHASPNRLTSWKEIAAHLQVSPRTAQRWEAEYGLPVHRRKRSRGELILGFRSEIDAWERRVSAQLREREGAEADGGHPTESAEAGRPVAGSAKGPAAHDRKVDEPRVSPDAGSPGEADARRRRRYPARRVILALGLVAIALAAIVVWSWHGDLATVRFDPANKTLTARDRAGRILWTNAFDFLVNQQWFSTEAEARWGPSLIVEDIDGDGLKETLFVSRALKPADQVLSCFNSSGSLRFAHRPREPVMCGSDTYAADLFSLSRLLVSAGPPPRAIWLVSSHREFPTVVQQLRPDGGLATEIWLNGHVKAMAEVVREGRRFVLAAGTSNDPDSGGTAALTMIDPAQAAGAVPALQPAYRCGGLALPAPAAFVKFPRLDTARVVQAHAYVEELYVRPDARIDVVVGQGGALAGGGRPALEPRVKYTLDLSLNVLAAVIEDNFAMAHAEMERTGRLDHRCGTAEQEGLWDILSWRDGKAVSVRRPVP